MTAKSLQSFALWLTYWVTVSWRCHLRKWARRWAQKRNLHGSNPENDHVLIPTVEASEIIYFFVYLFHSCPYLFVHFLQSWVHFSPISWFLASIFHPFFPFFGPISSFISLFLASICASIAIIWFTRSSIFAAWVLLSTRINLQNSCPICPEVVVKSVIIDLKSHFRHQCCWTGI